MEINAPYTSYVAVGDSFTEGMSDGLPDGSYRGWADLLAARLARRAAATGSSPFRYANLAVRGKLIAQIVDEQSGPAAAMGGELVTLVGGLNDVLRPKCDVDRVCAHLAEAAAWLAPSCEQLVLMRSPGRQGPVLEHFRPRMEQLFAHIDTIAERHGAIVVDLYGSRALADPRMWAEDRLHLNAEGHRRVAEAVWQALGQEAESEAQTDTETEIATEADPGAGTRAGTASGAETASRTGARTGAGADWDAPLPPYPRPGWATRRAADLRFARRHLAPWIGRRLTGRSSGDGRPAKRPELLPYEADAHDDGRRPRQV